MGLRVHIEKFHANEAFWTITDIIMLILLSVHIGIMSIEWMLGARIIMESFASMTPVAYEWYIQHIHENFVIIDLIFVSIYIGELFLRWFVAIVTNKYHRWFFYPFIHWYDVLGSIPLGSFRFLRIFRIFSVLARLQKKGIVDLKDTYFFNTYDKYANIIMEELSDRVVLKVLEGVQEEVKRGTPLMDEIITQVILPRRVVLVEWLSNRIQQIVSHASDRHQKHIRMYLEDLVEKAVDRNKEFKNIERIPGIGGMISHQVERAISDITFNVLNGIIQDLASPHNREIIDELAEMGFEAVLNNGNGQVDQMIIEALIQSLELVKKQVTVKNWKIKYGSGDEVELLSLLD